MKHITLSHDLHTPTQIPGIVATFEVRRRTTATLPSPGGLVKKDLCNMTMFLQHNIYKVV